MRKRFDVPVYVWRFNAFGWSHIWARRHLPKRIFKHRGTPARLTGGGLTASRLHQSQAPIPQTRRPLPFRSPAQPQRTTVPDGGGLRAGDNEPLRDAPAGLRNETSAKFSSPQKGSTLSNLSLERFEAQAGTGTGLPRRTWLSVWPPLPMA